MTPLADFLNAVAFNLWQQPVTVAELIGFITGALCVWGVARQYAWNWPVGFANNLVFASLFFGAELYADAVLQLIFAALAVYGWFQWTRGRADRGGLSIRNITKRETLVATGVAVAAQLTVVWVLVTFTNSSVPWPDAFVLVASLVATWFQAKKVIAHWWIWMVVDVVSVPLYIHKGLWLTAVLYVGFFALCVYGYRQWSSERTATSRTPQPTPAPQPTDPAAPTPATR